MSLCLKILIASLLINLIIWVVLFVRIKPTQFPIVLHYNIYFGTDLLGHWQQVFALPLIGLIIISINAFLAWLLPQKKLKYFLNSASFVCQSFLLIGAISIIVINA